MVMEHFLAFAASAPSVPNFLFGSLVDNAARRILATSAIVPYGFGKFFHTRRGTQAVVATLSWPRVPLGLLLFSSRECSVAGQKNRLHRFTSRCGRGAPLREVDFKFLCFIDLGFFFTPLMAAIAEEWRFRPILTVAHECSFLVQGRKVHT